MFKLNNTSVTLCHIAGPHARSHNDRNAQILRKKEYDLNSTVLTESTEEKDLKVLIDNHLTF